ncbi:hypothetical protein LTR84_005865 [Exophiala bonariae]|uniref:Uncharacterized protein n=1 Tax=Exophiala bonariae TaxID=1690606 RepID=A0AAV9N3E0_9EURO|nr:hypothetical protein LTR84_005865 [Exophiala bonariae]
MIYILAFVLFWLNHTHANRLAHRNADQIVLDTGRFNSVPNAENVSLRIDHNNKTSSNFSNRFYVKADWYEPGGPVFLYDGGEGTADTSHINSNKFTSDKQLSFFERFLKGHRGLGIVWEHRYYGESLPLPQNRLIESREEDFKYLTTKQALDDVMVFASSFKRSEKQFKGVDLTPKKTPWIFIGCSYPGVRAAIMRVAYPDTIFASYAASAPIEAKVDMSSYYQPIWSGMTSYLSNIWGTWQNYGMEREPDPENETQSLHPGLRAMCDHISYNNDTGTMSDAKGWAHRKGVDFTLDRLQSWPGLIDQIDFGRETISCPVKSVQPKSPQCVRDDKLEDISWKYQYCTKWGYLQVGNPGVNQIVSKYYDLNFFRHQCQCQFNFTGTGNRAIPLIPQVDLINRMYGGQKMRPSRTFLTDGEFDPWRTLSPLMVDNITIPDYDAPTTPEAPLFGRVLRNKQHCGDFDSYDEDAKAAHARFSEALNQWLCSYTKKNKNNLNKGAENILCPKK